MNIKEFLNEYGDQLKEKTLTLMKPTYNAAKPELWDKISREKLGFLKREPFAAQTDTILAIAKGFYKEDRKSLLLVGEMGVGKSLLGISVNTLNPKKHSRTLILCPSHLVEKWAREILITDPRATDVRIIRNISDVNMKKPVGREYWVLSKEKAKLHYSDTDGRWIKLDKETKAQLYHCSHCGRRLNGEIDIKKCSKCNTPLGGAHKSCKLRRYSIAEYIKRHKKNCYLNLLIADELHELKGGETAQGQALHALAVSAEKTLGLSGTLMGGYASNLYHILFRLFTRKMIANGYRHNSSMEFSQTYGIVDEIHKKDVESDRVASIGKTKNLKIVQEKPGVSPLLLPNFLLEETAFLWIDDIAGEAMPTYDEFVEVVPMEAEQASEYKKFEKKLVAEVQSRCTRTGNNPLLGALVNSLYALPDGVRRGEQVFDPITGVILIEAPALDIPMTNKEERLLELLEQEKAQGRKCVVYLEHTGTRDLIPDLVERMESRRLKPLVLRSDTTTTANRESWIRKKIKSDDPDVLICNPNLVKTGLDLLEFPTLIYFQAGYSIYTLRQSSRRSWRIGQTKPVKVYYMCFEGTAQERAMKLIATKLETANAVEGKLAADGLSAMSESSNGMVYELARSIMDNKKESSMTETWNNYRKSEVKKMRALEERPQIAPIIKPTPKTVSLSSFTDKLWKEKGKTKGNVTTLSVFDLLAELELTEAA